MANSTLAQSVGERGDIVAAMMGYDASNGRGWLERAVKTALVPRTALAGGTSGHGRRAGAKAVRVAQTPPTAQDSVLALVQA
jgi:hypothetical protein